MIHQYKNNGYAIVMDVNSGAVHVVDDVVYDAVELLAAEMPEVDADAETPAESDTGSAGCGSGHGAAEESECTVGGVSKCADCGGGYGTEGKSVCVSNSVSERVDCGSSREPDGGAECAEQGVRGDVREGREPGAGAECVNHGESEDEDIREDGAVPGHAWIPAGLRTRVEAELAERGYGAADIADAFSDIEELIGAGQLFAKDIYRDYVTDFKKRGTVVKALCLHVAHDCNLACRYCFAEEGEYHGRRELMSLEVGRKALDFLIANSGGRRHLEVDFFGGEPLMNWEVVKQLVEYGRSLEAVHDKKFRFTLTTNGVLLNDEIMEFCNREMSNVVLSLDGRKEVNDRMRPFRNGAGSYDLIVPKFQKFAASRGQKNYYIRGTFTRNNLDFASDVLHFADLGFTQMSMEPVVASPDEPYAIRREDLPQILAEYDRLAVEYINRKKEGCGFNFFHFMIDLDQGPCVAKRLAGCGSGTEYLAVTPWGDLYPCHQFVGQEAFLLGNVDEGITNTALRDDFKLCNVYAKEKCRDCFARFYCSGGCAANAWNYDGAITGAYEIGCEMQKKRIECAIMIKAALAEQQEREPATSGAVA